MLLDGLQTIGYTHGDYNLATTLNQKHTTYSVFAGANYFDVSNNQTEMAEFYCPTNQSTGQTVPMKPIPICAFRLQHQKENGISSGNYR